MTVRRSTIADLVLLVVLSLVGLGLVRFGLIVLLQGAPPCAEGMARFGMTDGPFGSTLTLLRALLWTVGLCALYALSLFAAGLLERVGRMRLAFRTASAVLLVALLPVTRLLTPDYVPAPVETVRLDVVPERVKHADLPPALESALASDDATSDDPDFTDLLTLRVQGDPDRRLQAEKVCLDRGRRLLILRQPRVFLQAVGQGDTRIIDGVGRPASPGPLRLGVERGAWWDHLRAQQSYKPLTETEIAALDARLSRRPPR